MILLKNISTDSSPHICGGRQNGNRTDRCYKYHFQTNAWQEAGTLPRIVGDSGHASSEQWGLVVSGGRDDVERLATVFRTADGVFFDEITSLPAPTENHCLVVLSDTRLFIAGGYVDGHGDADEAYVYDSESGDWTSVGNMPGPPRHALACGLAVDPFAPRRQVVVAGGRNFATVDLYDVDTGEWRTTGS